MHRLASAGWLFASERGIAQANAAAEWDYWALFDFNKVEWSALSAGTRDILMLVLIGALSLPIFASAAALEWGGPDFSMNHEFVGHGISNVVAGAMGTLPNLFVGTPTCHTRSRYSCNTGVLKFAILPPRPRRPPRSSFGRASHACLLFCFVSRLALCAYHTGLGPCAIRWHRADLGITVGVDRIAHLLRVDCRGGHNSGLYLAWIRTGSGCGTRNRGGLAVLLPHPGYGSVPCIFNGAKANITHSGPEPHNHALT
jgi:hypothetical protein